MNDLFEFSESYAKVRDLIWKHLKQESLTEDETKTLDEWLTASEHNKKLFEDLNNNTLLQEELIKYHIAEKEKEVVRQMAMETVFMHPPAIKMKWNRLVAAAVIVLLISSGIFYLLFRDNNRQHIAITEPANIPDDIPPGTDKAILTLANGEKIILDDAQSGTLAKQGNAEVMKETGSVKYQSASRVAGTKGNKQSVIVYNTVSTPNGGQYQVGLADGSKVWLNAASSIRFPTEFSGDERIVEITGEAYFEVKGFPAGATKGKGGEGRKPFIVRVVTPSGVACEIQVLGTHFNVNAYNDEEVIKTTLLEGKVKVESANGNRESANGKRQTNDELAVVLKPGEQAIMVSHSPLTIHHSPLTIDHSPNIEQAVAWKNGLFNFRQMDIRSLMRQISRWYDVGIVYAGKIDETQTISGEAPRSTSLANLIKVLQLTDVNCRIEGKKLIVEP